MQVEAIIQNRRSRGLWYQDDDFPGDRDEDWFYMSKGSRLDASTSVEESIGAKGTTEVDKENIQDLLGPEGALQNGLLPALRVDGKDGVKSVINDVSNMSGEGRQCKKPAKKTQPEPAEPVEPTKPIELAKAGLATVRERLCCTASEKAHVGVSRSDLSNLKVWNKAFL